ncbi:C40 family peptidase [Nonomuraea spiralis]|uniref:C40 family peptidase n=1 Tax=Nonomuraea spiralis TaxID=46182 RepID=A0ABV5INK7_9ACTN|nr:C40 family peptidase [Nonomuraea spiralis]GGT43837.1 hypothetical protein GCM10010176_104100 [Nonomuraea spiralis]
MPVITATAIGALALIAVLISVIATLLPGYDAPSAFCGTSAPTDNLHQQTATVAASHACAPLTISGAGRGSAAVAAASRWLGTPYSYGGGGLDGPTRGLGQGAKVGFDCSGLIRYAWHQAGTTIPRTTVEQWQALVHVPPGHQASGDLVFFQGFDGGPNRPGHVGLVLDAHHMIEAPRTGLRVRISRYTEREDIIGYGRPSSTRTS